MQVMAGGKIGQAELLRGFFWGQGCGFLPGARIFFWPVGLFRGRGFGGFGCGRAQRPLLRFPNQTHGRSRLPRLEPGGDFFLYLVLRRFVKQIAKRGGRALIRGNGVVVSLFIFLYRLELKPVVDILFFIEFAGLGRLAAAPAREKALQPAGSGLFFFSFGFWFQGAFRCVRRAKADFSVLPGSERLRRHLLRGLRNRGRYFRPGLWRGRLLRFWLGLRRLNPRCALLVLAGQRFVRLAAQTAFGLRQDVIHRVFRRFFSPVVFHGRLHAPVLLLIWPESPCAAVRPHSKSRRMPQKHSTSLSFPASAKI